MSTPEALYVRVRAGSAQEAARLAERLAGDGWEAVEVEEVPDPTAGTCRSCHEVVHDAGCDRIGDHRPFEDEDGNVVGGLIDTLTRRPDPAVPGIPLGEL